MHIDKQSGEIVGWMAFGSILMYTIMIISPIISIGVVFVLNRYFPDVQVSGWIAVVAIVLVGVDILRSLVGTVNCIAICGLIIISVIVAHL